MVQFRELVAKAIAGRSDGVFSEYQGALDPKVAVCGVGWSALWALCGEAPEIYHFVLLAWVVQSPCAPLEPKVSP